MTGSASIPAGVASFKVTGANFPSFPARVVCTVAAPAGGRFMFASVVAGSLSQDGFSVDLSGPPSTTQGYMLHWFAAFTLVASDTFESYAAGPSVPSLMEGGEAWAAAWSWTVGAFGVVSEDTFESYAVTADITGETLDGEAAWSSPWSWGTGDLGLRCYDTVESYVPVVDVPGGSVSINMTGVTPGQFKYEDLSSPITLEAGANYYLVSSELNGGDQWYDSNTVISVTGVAESMPVYSSLATNFFELLNSFSRTYGPLSFKYSTGVSFVTGQSLGTVRNNFSGFVGMRITVGPDPIVVTALGRWCISGNSEAHTVKLVKCFYPLNGQNGGSGWSGAYVDRTGDIGVRADDKMEQYSDAAAVNGLSGGTGWNGAYVDR